MKVQMNLAFGRSVVNDGPECDDAYISITADFNGAPQILSGWLLSDAYKEWLVHVEIVK